MQKKQTKNTKKTNRNIQTNTRRLQTISFWNINADLFHLAYLTVCSIFPSFSSILMTMAARPTILKFQCHKNRRSANFTFCIIVHHELFLPFTVLESEKLSFCELYVLKKYQSAHFIYLKLWNVRSGMSVFITTDVCMCVHTRKEKVTHTLLVAVTNSSLNGCCCCYSCCCCC